MTARFAVQFTVPGPVVGKGRPRIIKIGGHARMKTPEKTATYENLIALAAEKAMDGFPPFEGPVRVSLTIAYEIPAGWPAWKREAALCDRIRPTVKPDSDNVLKALCDAINGIVWRDDVQVVHTAIAKIYAETPGLAAKISGLDALPAQTSRKADLEAL